MKRCTRECGEKVISAVFAISILLGFLTQATTTVSAQLTESFETGWGDWYPDYNEDPAYFDIQPSSLYAYDGAYSIKLGSHGLPSPKITAWIARTVPVPPNAALNVGLTFQLYSESPPDTPREVLAYIGNNNISDYPDFTPIGSTDQLAGWFEYTYSNSFTTSPSGEIWVALGFFNQIVGFKSYWVDWVEISGISIDNDPPEIIDLQPLNQTTIAYSQPLIAANYTDASGVSIPGVVLEVDATNVTSFASVTASGVTYTPPAPLTEGVHDVNLEATDDSSNRNRGVKSWWFTVDTIPPQISNVQPANLSSTGSSTPTIEASFSDATSGTDATSVKLLVDTIDVTGDATITPTSVSYLPLTPLSDGQHEVYVQVGDNSNPQNMGKKSWAFTVDKTPPLIMNLQPENNSQSANDLPTIRASYSDPSGIEVGSVVLEVDTFDVTLISMRTATEVTYVPLSPLSDGVHDVHLKVSDVNGNPSEVLWSFIVDATAPSTTLNILSPQYTDMTGKTFIKSSTPLNLTWDDGSGTGVETVEFQFYGFGESEPGYSQYVSDFTIPDSKADGLVYIKHKSTDKLGNEEAEQLEQVYLDNTPPTTNIAVAEPSITISGTTFVTSDTTVTLTPDDGSGSGVSDIMFGIDDPSCPSTYDTPILLNTVTEGPHVIYVKAEDNVDNEETVSSVDMYLDETAPETAIIFGNPNRSYSGITYVNADTEINFSPDDGEGSGTASTRYKILKDGSTILPWTEYVGTSLSLSGEDGPREVLFKSTDNLGKEESDKTVLVYLDTTAPMSGILGFDVGTIYFNNTLETIVIWAQDGYGSGVKEIRFGIDDPNCPNTYTGPIVVGTMSEGSHTLYFKAEDNVDNEEEINSITVVLDITAPTADAGWDVDLDKGETVTLNAGGSDDGASGSGISNYTWTIVYDGSTITLYGPNPGFTFDEEGTYHVTLTITDNAGHESTDTTTVTVAAQEGAEFPWWILVALVVVVVAMLLLFAVFKKKKGKEKSNKNEERECDSCGHVLGPHDIVCPECDNPVAVAPRR